MESSTEDYNAKSNCPAYYKDFPTVKHPEQYQNIHEIAFGINQPIQFESKTTVQPTTQFRSNRSGSTTSGTNIEYYNETLKRIAREHRVVIHARTRELIGSCTEDTHPKIYHKMQGTVKLNDWLVKGKVQPERTPVSHPHGHLGGFPTVPYHRAINRVQISGKFTVAPRSSTERVSPTECKWLNYKLQGELVWQNTTQLNYELQGGVAFENTSKLNFELQGRLAFKNTSQYKTVWNTKGQRRSRV